MLTEQTEHFVFIFSNPTNNSIIGTIGNTTINILDNDPASVKNILGEKNCLLIPNPSNDKVLLMSNGQFEFYEIRDAAGRIISASNINSQTVSSILLNNFNAGVYFVYLHNLKGVEILKLIKQ